MTDAVSLTVTHVNSVSMSSNGLF